MSNQKTLSYQKLYLFLYIFSLLIPLHNGFYVPGVAPKEFKFGEFIDVRAIKLTSTKTVVPYEYYSLPFCKPDGELHYKSENLGEIMRGDRIVNTPYEVSMKKDVDCSTLCTRIVNSPKMRLTEIESNLLRQRINEDYHVHLLIDNLPCATRYVIPETEEVFFDHGYKLGWVDENSGKIYVNNHLEIVLKYHQPTEGVYRVVGFEVQPKSIDLSKYNLKSSSKMGKKCNIVDSSNSPQEILIDTTNEIIWSYSVRWDESDIPWASRWGFLSVIIVRTVRRDIAKYNRDEDAEDTLEETGWKLVHGDVFRPPKYAELLVNFIGTGIQLIGMVGVTVSFAMLGMLSPASRGSLTTVAIVFYCFMGLIAGYHSGRLYKTLRGTKPMRCALRTAIFFPGLILGTGFILNFFLIGKHSSGAIPFTTMIALLFLWFGVDLPLVFLGFYFGYRKQMYTHPVRTNQIPRQVPEQPWYTKTFPCMLLAGILPFGAVFIELYFIFSALWENQFYYLFGFLFIVLGILYISCSQIAIVFTYFLLVSENYHWWWKSFVTSGGSALYVMAYSIFYYYAKLNIIGAIPTILFFTYSFLIALTFWLLTGTIGFYAAYFFLCKIYGQVKID